MQYPAAARRGKPSCAVHDHATQACVCRPDVNGTLIGMGYCASRMTGSASGSQKSARDGRTVPELRAILLQFDYSKECKDDNATVPAFADRNRSGWVRQPSGSAGIRSSDSILPRRSRAGVRDLRCSPRYAAVRMRDPGAGVRRLITVSDRDATLPARCRAQGHSSIVAGVSVARAVSAIAAAADRGADHGWCTGPSWPACPSP